MVGRNRFARQACVNKNHSFIFDQVGDKFEMKLVTCSHINVWQMERIDMVGDPGADAVVRTKGISITDDEGLAHRHTSSMSSFCAFRSCT